MNKELELYIETFGSYPPISIGVDIDSDEYKKLMFNAVLDNKEITMQDIEKALENVEYDVVLSDKEEKKPTNNGFKKAEKYN